MNNKIIDMQELTKLSSCKKLERLTLVNNMVTEQPGYRLFVIAHIPSLRVLDFEKVTKDERKEAEKLVPKEKKK